MKIYLIRHGATAGNAEKRYIGRTDEPLSEQGRAELGKKQFPNIGTVGTVGTCGTVVCSPMKRCTETAELLFGHVTLVCEKLRECDFGRFEGHNYAELNGDPDYQAWIDSGGTMPFPEGEPPEEFRKRCCEGFTETLEKLGEQESVAFVVHGGTIMSILERFAVPKAGYYDYMTDNGCGWVCEWDGEKLTKAVRL